MLDLKNKTAKEKSQIKSLELAKVKFTSAFTKKGIKIKIVRDIKHIEINREHGIELFAQAWKNGKQLGFGKDGSIDIERFRIFNPPVLVDNANGDIIREWIDEFTGELKQRKLKYDPLEAIKQDLAHTVSLVAKDGKNIVKGKIGNTTSTFRPVAGANSPCDGYIRVNKVDTAGLDWNNAGSGIQDNSTADNVGVSDVNTGFANIFSDSIADKWRRLRRTIYNFDTSPISTDDISSAILSFSGNDKADGGSIAPTYNIFSVNPAGTADIVVGDYDAFGTTRFSSDLTFANAPTDNSFANFSFNASGIADVNKSGVSSFGGRMANYDADNVEPSWGASELTYWQIATADTTGTASDPKLVVVHSAVATGNSNFLMFM